MFERYRFNTRTQQPGESYDQNNTALSKLAEGCQFQSITPEEILRYRLVFGTGYSKAREGRREGGREGGREGEREGGKEGGKEGGRLLRRQSSPCRKQTTFAVRQRARLRG